MLILSFLARQLKGLLFILAKIIVHIFSCAAFFLFSILCHCALKLLIGSLHDPLRSLPSQCVRRLKAWSKGRETTTTTTTTTTVCSDCFKMINPTYLGFCLHCFKCIQFWNSSLRTGYFDWLHTFNVFLKCTSLQSRKKHCKKMRPPRKTGLL